MPSLKLSNPFRRGAGRPSMKQQAAALKETAGRVISEPKAVPKAAPNIPAERAFAIKQAASIDLSNLSIMQLGVLFDRFDAASNTWNAELHLPYANDSKTDFRLNTAAGELLEREQERSAEIRDRIAAEIDRRQPANERDANAQLKTLITHELMCNGDLRDPAIRARIEAAWGSAPAHGSTAESVGPVGNPLGDLLAGLDLSAMSMQTLSALYDHVETLNNICYGLAAQPCSLNRDRMLNEAGTVMYRLTEGLLQRASDACLSEARRRGSASDDDCDIRLAMVARQTIENDDPDEIRALARDLLMKTEG